MPNRIIKESICTSDTLEQLTPEQEILFYRILVNCDDYGRMDARVPVVRAKCFPLRLDCVTDDHVRQWLMALMTCKLVIVYEIEGRPYMQVCTWEKHQQIRAKRSKYPAPDGKLPASDIIGNQLLADVPVIQSESNPNPYMVKNFDIFWSAFPKKKAKGDAEKAFKKLKPDEALMAIILAAIEKAKKSDDWLKESGKYIPHPATWLNGKRWEDEITDGTGRGTHPKGGTPLKARNQYTQPEAFRTGGARDG